MDDDSIAWDPEVGVWAAVLGDTNPVTIVFNGGPREKLDRCTVVRADRDAMLVTTETETLLIPTTSVSYVELPREDWLRRAIREGGVLDAPGQSGAPIEMQTEQEGGE